MTRAHEPAEVAEAASRIKSSRSGSGRRAARLRAAHRRRADDERLARELDTAHAEARARPELLSLLSHDLRNPLSIMTLGLHSLSRQVAADHPARRHVDSLRRAADELGQMLETMSEAARVDRGDVPLSLAPEPVSDLVAAACATPAIQRVADDRQITLARELEPGVGVVLCAREKLGRVLSDLVSRAVRLSPKKSRVTVSAARGRDATVVLRVADAAAEIPPRYAAAVFDLPRDDGQRRATGQVFALDLFAARGVIAAQGGTLHLEAGAGEGSVFVITLPEG